MASTVGVQADVKIHPGTTQTVELPVNRTGVCQINGAITFPTNSSFVSADASNRAVLKRLATTVKAVRAGQYDPFKFLLVVGHTDSTGNAEVNQRVSERRVKSVQALLNGKTDVWEELFRFEGWGNEVIRSIIGGIPEKTLVEAGLSTDVASYSVPDLRKKLFEQCFLSLFADEGEIDFTVPPILACGQAHLLRGSRQSPSRLPDLPQITGDFPPNRRVEFFLSTSVSSGISCDEYAQWSLSCDKPKDFFDVNLPPVEFNKTTNTGGVVSMEPFQRTDFQIGDVAVAGRASWNALEPKWDRVLTYYNTITSPLPERLNHIIVHHTANDGTINEVQDQQTQTSLASQMEAFLKGLIGDRPGRFADIAYHFFIDKDGKVFEGRPLEVMGSHSGEGPVAGPGSDPDFGSIGIVLQGSYDNARPTAKALKSLRELVEGLKKKFGVERLLMHREIPLDPRTGTNIPIRKGKATVCPGSNLVGPIRILRKELGLKGLE